MTFTLIGINVGVFLLELLMGAAINGNSGWIYEHGVLVSASTRRTGRRRPEGDWWRLITAPFLHYGPLHLGMNMLVLWFIGPPLEEYFGHGRYAARLPRLRARRLGGSAHLSPNALTVGASGAIWGLMGAALVLEARQIYVFGGQAMGLVVFNLVFTFLIPGISIGGHIGGLDRRRAVRARVLEPAAHARRSRRSRSRRSALLSVGVAIAQVG